MEPQSPTIPTPPQPVAPPVPATLPKKNNSVVILLSILLLVAISAAAFFALQTQKLTKFTHRIKSILNAEQITNPLQFPIQPQTGIHI